MKLAIWKNNRGLDKLRRMPQFIDSRVTPILLRRNPNINFHGLITNDKDGFILTIIGDHKRITSWRIDAGSLRKKLDGRLRATNALANIPVLESATVSVYDDSFLNLRTQWEWSVLPQNMTHSQADAISEVLQGLVEELAVLLFKHFEAPNASTFGFEGTGLEGPYGNKVHFRRYNNFVIESLSAGRPNGPWHLIRDCFVLLAWQVSKVQPPVTVGNGYVLEHPGLMEVLHVDAMGLCYSAAIHVSTIRAGNVLAMSKSEKLTAGAVRTFLEELSMSTTKAEILLGWASDDEKAYLDEYVRINDFDRRYKRLMDLERGLSHLADRLAAAEAESRSSRLNAALAAVTIVAFGSAVKDIFDLVHSNQAGNYVALSFAGAFILIGAYVGSRVFGWRRKT